MGEEKGEGEEGCDGDGGGDLHFRGGFGERLVSLESGVRVWMGLKRPMD